MIGELSNLSDAQLADWLKEVRRVAALPDDQALVDLDNLLWGASEMMHVAAGGAPTDLFDPEYGTKMLDGELRRLRERIERLAKATTALPFESTRLREEAQNLGRFLEDAPTEAQLTAMQEVQTLALNTAEDMDARGFLRQLDQAAATPIARVTAVVPTLATIDRAVDGLNRMGRLTPEIQAMARQAKVRAARWRYEKRMAEAEVAIAGGSDKKANRYRGEAAVMLRQDWTAAFPGEDTPTT